MNKLRYYHYISKTKLDILEPQLTSGFSLSEVTSKSEIGLPGVGSLGLEMGVKRPEEPGLLAGRMNRVMDALQKRKLISGLDGAEELESGEFYSHRGEWRHGLYIFNGAVSLEQRSEVASYLAWRLWKDAFLLLVGSPGNILGENYAKHGVEVNGTLGTWSLVMEFAKRVFNSENDAGFEERRGQGTGGRIGGEVVPLDLLVEPDGFSLGLLCARFLTRLPEEKLNLAFRVSKTMEIRRKEVLPRWAKALFDGSPEAAEAQALLWRCKTIVLGSPLFTAVG